MPSKWQVRAQPDGRLVWIPVSDAPPAPSPPPLPPAAPPLTPGRPAAAVASASDAPIKGPAAVDGCRVQSMADLLVQARSELVEGDAMAGETGDATKGGLFCTGSGRSVPVSERAIRRARALVEDETKQPFGDGADLESESRQMDAPFRGAVRKGGTSPMFQTGSGKAVSLSKDSIRNAKVVLRDFETGACPMEPMFHTGMGRSIPVSRTSIDKARAVLEGQTVAKQGDVESLDGMEKFPLFQTASGRSVSISVASFQKAKAVLKKDNASEGNMECFGEPLLVNERSIEKSRSVVKEADAENNGRWDSDCQFPMFQTGSGRPVGVSKSSLLKARTVLEEDNIKRNGHGDTSVCATYLQTETPRSVLMTSSLIMNDRSITPKGDNSMQEKYRERDDHLPLFQTGLGSSVSVSKSSVKRAIAILEPRNIAKELEDEAHSDAGHGTPVIKTGFGRSILATDNSTKEVQIEESVKGLNNATREGFAEDARLQAGIRKFVSVNRSSSHNVNILWEQGDFAEKGYKGSESQLPMFQTGSGKSVLISESSVQKARSVLEEDGNINRENHKLLHNTGKKFPVFASPLKTSCARSVNISSFGVSRAATLLGLEENTLSTQFFGDVGDKLGTAITVERENPEHRLRVASVHGISGGCPRSSCPTEDRVLMDPHQPFELSKNSATDYGEHSIRFSTVGGRSMAISSDALQRAKSLLGESDLGVSTNNILGHSSVSAYKEKLPNSSVAPKEDETDLSKTSSKTEPVIICDQVTPDRKHTGSFGYAAANTPVANGNTNRFHAGREFRSINQIPKIPKLSSRCLSETDNASHTNDKIGRLHMPAGVLVDITNYMGTHSGHVGNVANEKRRIGGRNSISISPFKRPRSSRFVTPINANRQSAAGVSKLPATQISPCRTKLSACYPFQHQRKTYKKYFGGPPCFKYLTEHVTDEVKLMDAIRAEKYKFQNQNTDTGAEELQKMLLGCGASLTYATKEWVSNHYKWIVWKLASLERCYPTRAAGKFLTIANVFEELKYRHDREVNNGHRSAIKKILEGSALPSLMMVLCISAIYSCSDLNNSKLEVAGADMNEDNVDNSRLLAAKRNMSAKIELTDGWYSLDASLDMALSEQLEKRKLFIGQKLRIWGASLCGWTGPVSFHEASGTVRLMIHVNGTYRARWNDTLGFCKHIGPPLAFKCIKASGGRVPRTLVGVARIYPILYKERLPDGRSVVRSERMETKELQLYHQRVSKIAEDILSEQQENCDSTDDNEEGAKIYKMLERAAEPEVMMASLTSEQRMSFSSYQTKQQVVRQNEIAKKVEKALEVAGLSSRDVTPFLKVRVMGLVSKSSATKTSNKEGLITIWNPTEKQKADLMEGQIYSVTGLVPSTYCTDILYLHARGSSTMWKPLVSAAAVDFEPFFTPRKAIELSTIGEVPLASEFDIAGVVLHVGNVYLSGNQKRQWLFLTDGSKLVSAQKSKEQHDCLLAVSFSSQTTGDDSAFFHYALSGNIVGFCNLVKRQKDYMRHMWVAEATDSSTYTLSHCISQKSHLKEAATCAEKWASRSYAKIQQLKERVLHIIGDSGG